MECPTMWNTSNVSSTHTNYKLYNKPTSSSSAEPSKKIESASEGTSTPIQATCLWNGISAFIDSSSTPFLGPHWTVQRQRGRASAPTPSAEVRSGEMGELASLVAWQRPTGTPRCSNFCQAAGVEPFFCISHTFQKKCHPGSITRGLVCWSMSLRLSSWFFAKLCWAKRLASPSPPLTKKETDLYNYRDIIHHNPPI